METVALPSLLTSLHAPLLPYLLPCFPVSLLPSLLPSAFLLYMLFSISCAIFTVNEGLKQAHLSIHPGLLGHIMNTVTFLVIPD